MVETTTTARETRALPMQPHGFGLQIEPDEDNPNLWNDGAVDYNEEMTRHHSKGGIVGCYGGSAEYMKWRDFKNLQTNFPSRLNCNPNAPDGKGA